MMLVHTSCMYVQMIWKVVDIENLILVFSKRFPYMVLMEINGGGCNKSLAPVCF
jgi:hypothetical protein